MSDNIRVLYERVQPMVVGQSVNDVLVLTQHLTMNSIHAAFAQYAEARAALEELGKNQIELLNVYYDPDTGNRRVYEKTQQ